MVDTQIHVVIDNGTGFMKGGFSGENAPRAVFPTLIGTPKENKLLTDKNIPRIIGQEALEKIGMANVRAPIEKGIIKDWEDMEIIWHHMLYDELRIAPDDHNIILTDIPLNAAENREKTVQMFFEKFNVPGLFISMTSVLAIYDSGRTSGMAIDSGEVITNFVPVYEGFAFPNAISKSETGGQVLTDYLISLLSEKKYNINTSTKKLKINEIKERYCRVSYDFENEIREAGEEYNNNYNYNDNLESHNYNYNKKNEFVNLRKDHTGHFWILKPSKKMPVDLFKLKNEEALKQERNKRLLLESELETMKNENAKLLEEMEKINKKRKKRRKK